MKGSVAGLLALALIPGVLQAASLTTEQRLERLERRVAKVTELTLQMDAMQRENRQLRGEIESLQYQIEQLKRKQRDIYLDIDQRLSNLSRPAAAPAAPVAGAGDAAEPAPPLASAAPADAQAPAAAAANADPQQIQADYQAAYALLSPEQRRYDDAAKAFSVFLENYPQSPLAANAQYWLAEAYYVSQQNDQSLQAFNKVVSDYPDSPKVPGALYKIGRLELVKGNQDAAKKALQRVVKDYPTAPAAGLAKELLSKIGR